MTPWEKDPDFVWPVLDQPQYRVPDQVPETMPDGLRIRELVQRARVWWDRIGRHMVRQQVPALNPEQGGVPSGILRCLEFEHLTREEAVTVCRTWYRGVHRAMEEAREEFKLDPLKGPGFSFERVLQ